MSIEMGPFLESLRQEDNGNNLQAMVPHGSEAKVMGTLHGALRRARIIHAISRTETQIVFSLTALATVFLWLNAPELALPGWTWIAVLLFGQAAVSFLVAVALTDPDSIKGAIASALEEHFNINNIADETIRAQVTQAVAHRANMEEVEFRSTGGVRRTVAEALSSVDEWLAGIGRLALRLESFRAAFQLQTDARPQLLDRIRELEQRIAGNSDKRTREQLRETMAGRRHQLRAIEEVESLAERGLLRLEHAVAALGTIHAQIVLFTASGEAQTDAAMLVNDINSEIRAIDAVLVAMDRVYAGSRVEDGVGLSTS